MVQIKFYIYTFLNAQENKGFEEKRCSDITEIKAISEQRELTIITITINEIIIMDLHGIYIYNAPKVVTLLVCSQGCPGDKLMESMTAGLHQATPLITFIGDIVFGKDQYVVILPS